jgi:biopolymer transport protein ExbD/biopolymer transport protein TolR
MAYSTMGSNGRARTQTALAEINITPLVDVVLVLLLIFMLTAPVLQSGIDVAIPQTRSTETLTETHMVVTIDKDDNVFLQSNGPDQPVNIADLPTLLSQNTQGMAAAKKVVYVRADERVQFGAFASVMEAVKQSGITNISIVTRPIEK